MKNTRRKLYQFIGITLGLFSLSSLGQATSEKLQYISYKNPQYIHANNDVQLLHKFREIRGFVFISSGFGKTPHESFLTKIKDNGGNPILAGSTWERGGGISSYSLQPLSLQKLHVEVYKRVDEEHRRELLYRTEVFVAERIPDDLLNDLRRDPKGSLRIKIRIHHDGVLLGWDIERRPGFDSKKRDQFGEAVYVKAVHSFAGGDFREAEIYNGKPVRKGWYIHPKTGEKIETDF